MSGAQRPGKRTIGPAPPPDGPTDGRGLAAALAATHARPPSGSWRRRLPQWLWTALATAAVVAVVITAVIAGAFAPLLRSLPSPTNNNAGSGSSAPPPTSFYGAIGGAISYARSAYWGWGGSGEPPLVFAEGLVSPTPLGAVVNQTRLGAVTCTPTMLAEQVAALPSDGGSVSAGDAPAWLFAFSTASTTVIVVAVVSGVSTLVASTATNGACYNGPGTFSDVVVDSTVAAATAADTAVSSAFFANARGTPAPVSAEYFLAPPGYVHGGPGGAPVWILTDTTCPLYGSASGSGSVLTSEINAASGSLISQSTASADC